MKKTNVAIALTSALLLSACSTAETSEDSNGNEQANSEATASSTDNEDKSNNENDSSNETDDIELSERSQDIYQTLNNYELPEEGRLTTEEKEEQFGKTYDELDDKIAYENGTIFEKERKYKMWGVWADHEVQLRGTQVLGALKTALVETHGYYNVQGESEGEVKPLEDVDKEFMENEIAKDKTDLDGVKDPKGFQTMHNTAKNVVRGLKPLEQHLNGYDSSKKWVTETLEYFEKVKQADESEWEDVYDEYRKGIENLDEMTKVLYKLDEKLIE